MFHLRLLAAAAVLAGAFTLAAPAQAGSHCCAPPPIKTTLCVVDPCTGCATELCVCVPACCCGDPCLACCTRGVLGRKILTYRWDCGHTVEVLVKRNGAVRLR